MYPQVREMASVFDPTGLVPVLCEYGKTIADSADACREAIEATR